MAARVLSAGRERLRGSVKFVFQPAEEGPGGAKPMIDAGVLRGPKVDVALGLHLWNDFPLGRVGAPDGPMLASADRFEIVVRGKGGHGAAPHQTVDPIVAAAQMVLALQTISSRNVSPLESVVVSVCQIAGGDAHNIIPDRVRMVGTLRAFDPRLRAMIARRVGEIARGVARSAGGRCDYDWHPGYPPTVNDPGVAAQVREIAAGVVGKRSVTTDARTLGGEDMAYFLREVPGCFFFLGSADPARGSVHAHHSARFDFDERALPLGLEIAVRAIRRLTGSDADGRPD